jgi:para-nitrobenzyl esterase
MAMPSAKGKFQRASVESGAALTNGSKDAAAASTQVLMKKLGVTTLKQLQDVPAQMMFDVLTGRANPGGGQGTMSFAPIIDGVAIPTPAFAPVANPLARDVAVMVGCTADEQTLYTIGAATFPGTTFDQLTTQYGAAQVAAARKAKPGYSAPYIGAFLASKGTWRNSVALAERKSDQPAGTYMWIWDWPAPGAGGVLKSPHTLELPFCFDNVDKGPLLLGVNGKIDPSTFKLATAVSTAWSNFAKTGDPNAPGLLPHWPRYNSQSRATMFFNKPSHVVDDPWPGLRNAPPITIHISDGPRGPAPSPPG